MKLNLSILERRLGYQFKNIQHLKLALTHRSYSRHNNERLEFLGDSILNFTIAQALFKKFPDANEGALTRLRARLVCEPTLAELANEIKLGQYLNLGGGEMKSGGFERPSILSDALEALIGAIYLDSDIAECKKNLLNWFASRLAATSVERVQKDPKTHLQEYLQSRKMALPCYKLVAVEGQAHEQIFTAQCSVEVLDKPTLGKGTSHRLAEQKAARCALRKLGVEVVENNG